MANQELETLGPLPAILEGIDLSDELAAIEERWIQPGKMLEWKLMDRTEWRIIGPAFEPIAAERDIRFGYCSFPSLDLFVEWMDGAPEHIAIHKKLIAARNELLASGQPLAPDYSFLATDEPNTDLHALREALKPVYRRLDQEDWLGFPPGFSIEQAMFGMYG